jgi:hypothetical protein
VVVDGRNADTGRELQSLDSGRCDRRRSGHADHAIVYGIDEWTEERSVDVEDS